MAILSDKWIRQQAKENGMIEPFVEAQRRDGCISYGLSSYGYDARVAPEFKIFTNVDSSVVDPKEFDPKSFAPYREASWQFFRTSGSGSKLKKTG
jgi:dCTP deaminase